MYFAVQISSSVQESKAILTQAKHARTASAHLSSHIDSAFQQLNKQEMLTDTANSQITSEVPNKDTFDQQNLRILICTSCVQKTVVCLPIFSPRCPWPV